jgi:hypothetical protein
VIRTGGFQFGDLAIPALLLLLIAPLPVAMWMVATRRGGVADALAAILPHGVWQGLAAFAPKLGLKTPYMTNLVLELPLVSLAVLAVLALRVRLPERVGGWPALALAIGAAALIFVLFPALRD